MPTSVVCLWFDGQAEQAAEHYVSIFPDSRITDTMRYGPGMPMPEGSAMTVSFTLDGREFVGLNGGPQYTFTEAISFQVPCADQTEVDHYWDRLVDGGEPGRCGWLKDRFGVSWQVVPQGLGEALSDPDPDRAGRAFQAMMGQGKPDLDEIRRAKDAG